MTPTPERLTLKVRTWDAPTVEGLAALVGGRIALAIPPFKSVDLELPAGTRERALETLRQHPDVERVGVPGSGKTSYERTASIGLGDPMRRFPLMQSQMQYLNLPRAWQHTKGAGSVPYGHVDNGFNVNLPQYAGKTLTTWSIINNTSTLTTQEHGSQTLASAIAIGDSATRPYGVAPEADAVVVEVGTAIMASDTAAAIVWAVDHGAKVINLSLGFAASEDPTGLLPDACAYAVANDAVTVWSAGNSAGETPYPQTTDPNVMVVGGVYTTGEVFGMAYYDKWMAGLSTGYGNHVDFVAPEAVWVLSVGGTVPYVPYAGTSYSSPITAATIHLVLCINPALTGMEAAQIVKATSMKPKPREAWMHDAYFPADCGVPDAEAAVLKAKTTLPANAGVVFPYLRIHQTDPLHAWGDFHHSAYPGPAAWDECLSGGITRHVGGTVGFQIDGFCSTGAVTQVELWINGVQEYIGPPTSTRGTLYEREEWRDRLWDLRVIARTATDEVGEQAYQTSATSLATAVNSVDFEVVGTEVAQPSAFSLQAQAADAYYLARNASLGRSYLAGPLVYIDWPQGAAEARARFGMAPSSAFTASWTAAEAMAESFGFASLGSFAATWSHAAQLAAQLGVTFSAGYIVPDHDAAQLAIGLGLESSAAFTASFSKAQTLVAKLGFRSVASFVAVWEEAQTVGARFGLTAQATYTASDEGVTTITAAFGFGAAAHFVPHLLPVRGGHGHWKGPASPLPGGRTSPRPVTPAGAQTTDPAPGKPNLKPETKE